MMDIKGIYALGSDLYIKTDSFFGKIASELAFKKVLNIDKKMSAFRDDSEVCNINKNAGHREVSVSEETYYVIKRAKEFNKISSRFDITIRPLVELWSKKLKENKIPDINDIEKAKSLVNSDDLVINNNAIYLNRKEQMIDLGAIAKGFATDISKDILKALNIKNALLDFGGNLYTLGKNKSDYWQIGIQNPFLNTGEIIGIIKSTDESIVTSGINERFTKIGDKKFHHIIDKQTGFPVENGIMSVTVIDSSSLDADALSTTILLEGLEEGIKIVRELKKQAIIITKEKEIFITKSLLNRFSNTIDFQIYEI
ncbi:MAG: FAD:protein FMN transferase [Clostridiales bacterium]|nr:FAD:protein FMN transferase [Clostridiales bacterium]